MSHNRSRFCIVVALSLVMLSAMAVQGDNVASDSQSEQLACQGNNIDISDKGIKDCVPDNYSPVRFLERLANRVIYEVKHNKSRLESEPHYAHNMVRAIILPYMDRVTMAALTVMHPWRWATEEDKKAFIEEYTHKVIDDYSSAMTDYSNEKVVFAQLRKRDYVDQAKVRVKSTLKGPRQDIPVEYRVKRSGGEWRVYDLVVNNISMVRSYRVQFKPEIKTSGLSGLVKRLKKLNMAKKDK